MSTTIVSLKVASTTTQVSFIPRGILIEKTARKNFRLAWKAYLRENESQSPTAFLAFCLLLGKPVSKAFSPVVRPSKLANGRTPYDTACNSARTLSYLASLKEPVPFLARLGIGPEEQKALHEAAKAVTETALLEERAALTR